MKQILLHLTVFLFATTTMFSQSPIVQDILNSVNQDSLIYFVRELSGDVSTIINGTPQTIQSRNKYQPGNALAETYIKQKLESYGLTTTIQSFSSSGKNVYAEQPGTEFPNQKYIICAHFDDMPSGTTAPGADDNASGTSAVIEAARIFSQHSFPFTIVYALWDEEEQGLIGSNYYATQAAIAGDSILGVINMDMISYDSNDDGIVNIHARPTAGNSVEIKDKMVECNSVYGINLSLVILSPGSTYSDHASFWSNNYGAILLIEDDFDFQPYYHTVNDLVQHFNQPYFVKSAKLAYATLASFVLNLNMNINHTPIASISVPGPINTTAFVSSGLDIGTGNLAPRLYYRTKSGGGTFGPFNSVIGTLVESGNYNFTIPTLSLGTIVQYYLAAQDANSSIVKTLPEGGSGYNPPGSTPPPTFFQFFVASQVVELYSEANDLTNWTSTGGWNTTTLKYVSPPTSFTDSPSGNYSSNANTSLKYNDQISLTGVLGATLEFETQWDIENNWDYGQVEISTNNGSTWIPLEGQYTNPGTGSFQPNGEPLYDGTQLSWVHETIDISGYAEQSISLRFILITDGSVTADGWYVDNIKITSFSSVATFALNVPIENGWNMVSIPGLHPVDQNVTTWWAGQDAGANVYKFDGSYQVVTIANPGEGYWMKHVGANTYNTGDEWPAEGIEIVANSPIPGIAGWNMIGGYENTVATSGLTTTPPGLILGSIYRYSGGYQVATDLVPGYAYWVKLSGPGDINIPGAGPMSKVQNAGSKFIEDDWGRIVITDNAGRSYTLYAVNGEVNLNKYELPPMPPTGMFDVRYGSGRIAEDISIAFQTIEMSSIEYPVKVRVEGMGIRIQDESGKMVNETVKSGEEITISNSQIQKLMVSGQLIPEEYSLKQNYPNPFNPSTVIEFSLPEDVADVKLTIYDALGQRVTELVNGTLEAGRYSYQWDASNVATGMYIYELRTNNFVSIKKMMLLR